ncbi:hypothetical protein IPV09_02390 [Tessaracoccus sp. SD287]|uniref:hypothetical protein n=1 Tax=Tessaracoccus sp. SD287 TaxID=2782008 RepID=UPI001A957C7C|nr:hypothetical protein [Tessaracoccus sp. SD287]MBO1030182.1 hypothetical protein [Tessaracoccus sp. SD287]
MTHVAHSSSAEPQSPESPGLLNRPVRRLAPGTRRILAYLAAGLPIGLLTGVIWHLVANPPGYLVAQNGAATMSERGLAAWFSADFWFAIIGLVVGLAIGVWGWLWFGRRGWVLVPLVLGTAVISALLCWWVGEVMGPTNFDERLSQAVPGDVVPIDLELTSLSALAAWPLGAIIPVVIASAFLTDPADYLERWRAGRVRASTTMLSEPVMPGGPTVTGRASEELGGPDDHRGQQ